MAIVTPADRPKSVRNRCVIEVFGGVLCVVTLLFGFSVGEMASVIGLSQISSFSLWRIKLEGNFNINRHELSWWNTSSCRPGN